MGTTASQLSLPPGTSGAVSGSSGRLLALPHELIEESLPLFIGSVKQVAALAQCCAALDQLLRGTAMRKLKAGMLEIRTASAAMWLCRCQLQHLLELRLDLQAQTGLLSKAIVENLVLAVSDALGHTIGLRDLQIRLATFDDEMDAIRVRMPAWELFVAGLARLAEMQRIRREKCGEKARRKEKHCARGLPARPPDSAPSS